MERKAIYYAIQQWRRERQLANEQGHQPPLIDSIPEDQEITLWQREDFMDISARSPELPKPQFIKPQYDALPVQHHEQRQQMRRITRDGK